MIEWKTTGHISSSSQSSIAALKDVSAQAVGTLPGLGGGTLREGWRPPNVPPWSGSCRCGAQIFLLLTFLSKCKILIIIIQLYYNRNTKIVKLVILNFNIYFSINSSYSNSSQRGRVTRFATTNFLKRFNLKTSVEVGFFCRSELKAGAAFSCRLWLLLDLL